VAGPPRSAVARRRLLAVVALAALALAVLFGVRAIQSLVRGYDPRGATVERVTVHSALLDRDLHATLVTPAGADGERRPLLVFLHGRVDGDDGDESNLSDELFAALERLGDRAPAIAFLNGGSASYWHDRADGPWGRYVLEEAIPDAVRRLGADGRRVAIGGISMGGFGAYDLARQAPGRFCAVGGHSAALWERAGDTAPGAFDGAEDFSRHDLIAFARADAAAWRGMPLWLDGGDEDPFRPGVAAFAAALRTDGADLRVHTWKGGHLTGYWRAHMAQYLRFYARALARCRR
jgi:enterochelin esterase-like enzyme